jgi:hypothetical protein
VQHVLPKGFKKIRHYGLLASRQREARLRQARRLLLPNSGIGWHTDAPRFGECVVGVSLGGDARFQFRPNGSEEVSYEIKAAPGSLYLMRGPTRWEYQHQVVPVKTERFSLTFRHVAE